MKKKILKSLTNYLVRKQALYKRNDMVVMKRFREFEYLHVIGTSWSLEGGFVEYHCVKVHGPAIQCPFLVDQSEIITKI